MIEDRDLSDYKLLDQYYLSDPSNIDKAIEDTGLSLEEILGLVGRFSKTSSRHGQIRGQVLSYLDGKVEIRTSFGSKKIWSSEND